MISWPNWTALRVNWSTLRDEKDQEIAILQEGMDTTLQQLSEVQQVRSSENQSVSFRLTNELRIKVLRMKQRMHRLTPLSSTTGKNSTRS
jgi:hypothetical protein